MSMMMMRNLISSNNRWNGSALNRAIKMTKNLILKKIFLFENTHSQEVVCDRIVFMLSLKREQIFYGSQITHEILCEHVWKIILNWVTCVVVNILLKMFNDLNGFQYLLSLTLSKSIVIKRNKNRQKYYMKISLSFLFFFGNCQRPYSDDDRNI